MSDTDLVPVLDELLEQVVQALADACAPVRVATLETGLPAWDWCCEGHAFIRAPAVYPSNQFPQQTIRTGNCTIGTAVQIEVGVLRCAPSMQDNADAPDPEDVSATSRQVYYDAQVVKDVLDGFEIAGGRRANLILGGWEPYDVEGGCAGGFWQAWIDPTLCVPPCTSPSDEG